MRPLFMVLLAAGVLTHPIAAQEPNAVARLVPGALVRVWETSATGAPTAMQIVERRGDSLVVRRDAITSNGVMVQRPETRALAWRTLARLDVRGERVKDSLIEGAIFGFMGGVIFASLMGGSSSGDIDPISAPVALSIWGALGLLIGLVIDAAKDNTPWITVVHTGTP